jgi:hypothetical protein
MYDEIEIREIIFDAQSKIDLLFSGLKVVVVEDEIVATEKDVAKALSDRYKAGFSANDNIEYTPYRVSDPTLHSRPNWLASSRNNSLPSFKDVAKPLQLVKTSCLRGLYNRVSTIFRSFFNRREPIIAAPVASKNKNKVSVRIFKDGKAL